MPRHRIPTAQAWMHAPRGTRIGWGAHSPSQRSCAALDRKAKVGQLHGPTICQQQIATGSFDSKRMHALGLRASRSAALQRALPSHTRVTESKLHPLNAAQNILIDRHEVWPLKRGMATSRPGIPHKDPGNKSKPSQESMNFSQFPIKYKGFKTVIPRRSK